MLTSKRLRTTIHPQAPNAKQHETTNHETVVSMMTIVHIVGYSERTSLTLSLDILAFNEY